MMTREQVLEILKNALEASDGEQTEAVLVSQNEELTRFANSIIHQNTMQEDATLVVRVVKDKRIGIASSNILSKEEIVKTVKKASQIASLSPRNSEFISLPAGKPLPQVEGYVERTARTSPEERAEAVKILVEKAKPHGIKASGAFSTAVLSLGVANSLGVQAFFQTTQASFSTVLLSSTSAGYADQESRDVADIRAEEIAEEAIKRTVDGQNPRQIEVREMEAILLPYAVSEMFDYLAYMGLGATAFQEGRSFMNEAKGKKVVSEKITLYDDALDPRGFPVPFDFEGQPKKKVTFFEEGVARDVVYDSFTAFKEGKESTGHALPQPNSYGPLPMNLVLKPGDSTLEEMIKSTKDGVLITRFWYVRPVHPKLTVITGMTRDGTFKIENGKIAYPLCNLRFTASILETLAGTELVGKDLKLEAGFFGGNLVPALKVKSFRFTGQTTF
ncbi:MAG: TldD/PmbA family protein [Caldiserica bacterium]|jgi:predicted Zn-dependent protease|nr:TldD/PmbA family protein [Caldisericota bacterium]MDH7561830.1 TldD/PmbA family protein [Caldisericota bacterium]